jgi:hypothetical protein
MVSAEQMAAYVSAQVHALRYFSATSGQPQDHWGFAWAPRNATGKSAAQFAEESGRVLDRLAAAIRDSAQTPDPADPGSAACGPPGQNVYCGGDLEGARLVEAWKSFRTWTQPALSFTSAPQTIPAGMPSAAISLALVTSSGLALTTPSPLAVTVASSSPSGIFSTSSAGPWSSTLSLTIAAGTGSAGPFYYLDTRAGGHTLTASAPGVTSGTQTMTVTPGPVVALAVTPASATVRARGSQPYSAAGIDAHGNAVPVAATWSLRPGVVGTTAPRSGSGTVFQAGRRVGSGTIVASVATEAGPITASATVRVMPGRLRIRSIRYARRPSGLLVTVTAVDGAGKAVSASVASVLVRRDGRSYLSRRVTTGPAGRTTFGVPARRGGCFTTAIRRVSAAGFRWDGRTPRNRVCLRRPQ